MHTLNIRCTPGALWLPWVTSTEEVRRGSIHRNSYTLNSGVSMSGRGRGGERRRMTEEEKEQEREERERERRRRWEAGGGGSKGDG